MVKNVPLRACTVMDWLAKRLMMKGLHPQLWNLACDKRGFPCSTWAPRVEQLPRSHRLQGVGAHSFAKFVQYKYSLQSCRNIICVARVADAHTSRKRTSRAVYQQASIVHLQPVCVALDGAVVDLNTCVPIACAAPIMASGH